MKYDRIYPGKVWLDTNGKPIQAHGFSVFWTENEKLWCWYGENKEKTVGGKSNTVWHWGVRLYTSPDLYNWTDRGLIIPPTPEDLTSPLHPTYCMDRPHILYNARTKKYVAWLKIMAGEVSQFMSVLTADRFEGPYTFVRKSINRWTWTRVISAYMPTSKQGKPTSGLSVPTSNWFVQR